MKLEKLLQEFESIVYNDMQDYSQFTIDFIDDVIIDIPEEDDELEEYTIALSYRVENILDIIRKGFDRELFEDLLKRLNETK